MYQKLFTLIIITVCSVIIGFSQEKSFTNTLVNFVIKERKLVSKKYTDKVNSLNSKKPKGVWNSDFPVLGAPPKLPKEVSSDLKSFIHFTITPKHYIQYHIVDNIFESDTLYSPATIQIKKIDRKDLSVTKFVPLWFTSKTGKLYKKDICNYNQVTEYRNIVKTISGYKCFKVVLKNKANPNYLIELYVTNGIKLNYHPVINCPEIINKYYPLYIKKYLIGYPNDNFKEYLFVKSAL